jgi:hypothetical protein
MRFLMNLPWPKKKDRQDAIAVAKENYDQTCAEGVEVDASVNWLRSMREANNFRKRFQAALGGHQ